MSGCPFVQEALDIASGSETMIATWIDAPISNREEPFSFISSGGVESSACPINKWNFKNQPCNIRSIEGKSQIDEIEIIGYCVSKLGLPVGNSPVRALCDPCGQCVQCREPLSFSVGKCPPRDHVLHSQIGH